MADTPPPPRHPVDRRLPDTRGTHEPLWRHILGDRLRALRHERGQTLAETAARAGVSPQYLSEMERGLKEPSSEMIAAVTGALDVALVDVAAAIAERLRGRDTTAERLRGRDTESLRGSGITAAGPTCRLGYALVA